MKVRLLLVLATCASNSGEVPAGLDTFLVSRQAATGFSGRGTLKADALREADAYSADSTSAWLELASGHIQYSMRGASNCRRRSVQIQCSEQLLSTHQHALVHKALCSGRLKDQGLTQPPTAQR